MSRSVDGRRAPIGDRAAVLADPRLWRAAAPGASRGEVVSRERLWPRFEAATCGTQFYVGLIQSRNNLTDAALQEMLTRHLVEDRALRQDDFDSFYEKRKTSLLAMISEAMAKEVRRDDLAPEETPEYDLDIDVNTTVAAPPSRLNDRSRLPNSAEPIDACASFTRRLVSSASEAPHDSACAGTSMFGSG